MLDIDTIEKLFCALNEELGSRGVTGEVGICGGAVMCLVFKARTATRDVDGIFKPTREIREAAARVGRALGVPENWLNYPHLRVWAPTAEYMLAMKCVSARFDTHDQGDVVFLIQHLGLRRPDDVLEIVCRYYPEGTVPAKTRFLLEELLAS